MKNQIKVLIEITQDVYWEDWGTDKLVFRKGWTGQAIAHYEDGCFAGVSGESPLYKGVRDSIWKNHYKIIEILDGD